MYSLPIFLRLSGRPVILVGDGEVAMTKRRLLERAGARIVAENEDARVAIVAVEEDVQAEAAVDRLRARGILVNAVDRLELCDFTIPAIVDRAPVLIAIGTGGASAGLAKALRQRLEALLPQNLGALAQALSQARGVIRSQWPDAAARRRAIDAALAPGATLDPLHQQDEAAVQRWLDQPEGADGAPGIYQLRLRSGDPDDLTLREARLLGGADRVTHRPDVPIAILDRARADAVRIACDHPPGGDMRGINVDVDWER
jgi:uroporphyrin-III C-methyltransferase/precorrin-2 dehydrogenase/sirohydrochlorin ferrochelatase